MSVRTLGLVALLAVTPAFAATPINETRALDADGQVHIENIKGKIVVRTWSQPKVRITGTLGKGVEKLAVTGDARSLSIQVKYPNSHGGWNLWGRDDRRTEPSIIEVMMPQRASLDIDSVSAEVDVQQMAGRKLSVDSVSGDIVVTASSPGEASFESVSGDTTLRITTGSVQAESVSGDINLQGGLTGEVSLESVSGSLSVIARALDELRVSSVSGDATLRTGLQVGGEIKAETLSGTVDLSLPKSTSAKLHAETFSGDINSMAGHVHREEHGPGESLDATLGKGQGKIRLESFSGDVSVSLD